MKNKSHQEIISIKYSYEAIKNNRTKLVFSKHSDGSLTCECPEYNGTIKVFSIKAEDFNALSKALIDDYKILDWDEFYRDDDGWVTDNGESWKIEIQFEDGTVVRSSGINNGPVFEHDNSEKIDCLNQLIKTLFGDISYKLQMINY